jgi:hypothetical protein
MASTTSTNRKRAAASRKAAKTPTPRESLALTDGQLEELATAAAEVRKAEELAKQARLTLARKAAAVRKAGGGVGAIGQAIGLKFTATQRLLKLAGK